MAEISSPSSITQYMPNVMCEFDVIRLLRHVPELIARFTKCTMYQPVKACGGYGDDRRSGLISKSWC